MNTKYKHVIWEIDSENEIGIVFDYIITKKAFKERMIQYFLENGSNKKFVFQLQDSPNDTIYRIIPYITQRGNPGLMFYDFEAFKNKKSKTPF